LITARVQRQVAGLFVAEERGTHTLKGPSEPTILYRRVRASGGGRRSEQRQLTPLVGRDEEIAMLMRRWERARQGDGQLLQIVKRRADLKEWGRPLPDLYEQIFLGHHETSLNS
jgi:alkanesulfonate monooxygenase SsuD/methylene tetrahydromethanopterin reductase-like flavin-dependent oxidoreductase (luciferase family)